MCDPEFIATLFIDISILKFLHLWTYSFSKVISMIVTELPPHELYLLLKVHFSILWKVTDKYY